MDSTFPLTCPAPTSPSPRASGCGSGGVTDNKAYFNAAPCLGTSRDHFLDVRFNTVSFPTRSWNGYTARRGGAQTFDSTGTFLRTTGNQLHLAVPKVSTPDCPNRVDRSALAWFEIYYQRALQPQGDTLSFRSPGTAGPYHYDIGPFPRDRQPRLFDVTDPMRPAELRVVPSMWTGDAVAGWMLAFEDTASMVRRYRV